MEGMLDSFLWEHSPNETKEMPTVLKSEDELAKFTVDEHLSDVERTVLYLNGGQLVQQKHAIQNLPNIIRGRGRAAYDSVAGALKGALSRLDSDAQIATADAFATVARERLMSPADLQQTLVPLVCRNINKEKSEEESEAWLKALQEMVPMLDKESIKSEVLPLALSKGDVEESISSRVICARILGFIAPYLNADEIDRTFFKKALAMCQDVDYQIRVSMCQQLGAVAKSMGRDVTSKTLLEEVVELLRDEELQVRCAALTTMVQLLDIVTPDVRRSRVIPVLKTHLQPLELDPVVQKCLARNFGLIMMGVKGELDGDTAQSFYACFKHLAAKTDPELRRACAQQLPLVIKAAMSFGPHVFPTHFSDTCMNLASDGDEEVRTTLATELHELCRLVGREHCVNLLLRPLVKLLRDECQSVQAAVLPGLSATLPCFVVADELRKESAMNELIRAICDLEAGINRTWRMRLHLASAFPVFPQVFSSDQVYEHFVPMACRFLTGSITASVRPAVAEGMVCFFRFCKKERQRADIFLRMIREYGRAKSCFARMAFADMCMFLVRKFSARFIKEWVFELCLELLYDPVPNVRLLMTPVLPLLKQTIKLPEDVDLLERLNNAISNVMTDIDRDVSIVARQVNEAFKRMPVRMTGGAGMLDMNGLAGNMATYETEDRRKEEEEAEMTFTPEDAKELRSEILNMARARKMAAKGGADMGMPAEPPAANSKSGTRGRQSGTNDTPARPSPTGLSSRGSGGATTTATSSSSGPRKSGQTGADDMGPSRAGSALARTTLTSSAPATPSTSGLRSGFGGPGGMSRPGSTTASTAAKSTPLLSGGPSKAPMGGLSSRGLSSVGSGPSSVGGIGGSRMTAASRTTTSNPSAGGLAARPGASATSSARPGLTSSSSGGAVRLPNISSSSSGIGARSATTASTSATSSSSAKSGLVPIARQNSLGKNGSIVASSLARKPGGG